MVNALAEIWSETAPILDRAAERLLTGHIEMVDSIGDLEHYTEHTIRELVPRGRNGSESPTVFARLEAQPAVRKLQGYPAVLDVNRIMAAVSGDVARAHIPHFPFDPTYIGESTLRH